MPDVQYSLELTASVGHHAITSHVEPGPSVSLLAVVAVAVPQRRFLLPVSFVELTQAQANPLVFSLECGQLLGQRLVHDDHPGKVLMRLPKVSPCHLKF